MSQLSGTACAWLLRFSRGYLTIKGSRGESDGSPADLIDEGLLLDKEIRADILGR
jgi:hypothetical protein